MTGFESIAIGEPNYLDTPRAIYSKINADEKLDQVEGNKSLQMRLTLGTTDSKVSPVIDGQRVSTILTNNRVNSVVSNYATDNRVNSVTDDPTACQYLTKELQLENAATSIKIILSGHTNLMLRLEHSMLLEMILDLNQYLHHSLDSIILNSRGEIITAQNNDGLSDLILVIPSIQYGFGDNATL
jgi:hypothetical protein